MDDPDAIVLHQMLAALPTDRAPMPPPPPPGDPVPLFPPPGVVAGESDAVCDAVESGGHAGLARPSSAPGAVAPRLALTVCPVRRCGVRFGTAAQLGHHLRRSVGCRDRVDDAQLSAIGFSRCPHFGVCGFIGPRLASHARSCPARQRAGLAGAPVATTGSDLAGEDALWGGRGPRAVIDGEGDRGRSGGIAPMRDDDMERPVPLIAREAWEWLEGLPLEQCAFMGSSSLKEVPKGARAEFTACWRMSARAYPG